MRIYVNAAILAATLLAMPILVIPLVTHAAQTSLSSSPNDLKPARLVSLPAPTGQFERAPVSFSWALDPYAALATPAPYTAESREYWQTVEGTQLQRGVEVITTAPGAVIRISPARGSAQFGADALVVRNRNRLVRLDQATGAAELRAAGMEVDRGTAVIKLARENGAGRYTLQTKQAKGRYVVHVFEPHSTVVLSARTDRQQVLGGETIAVSMAMSQAGRALPIQAEALLVAPDGNSRRVAVTRDAAGQLVARTRVPLEASAAAGLWELQVFATGAGTSRDARTAFAVTAPTARFRGDAAVDAQRLHVAVPLEAASSGRYEVRGTLYATGPDGIPRPVAQAHSAAWFERGARSLSLGFDRRHVPAGFGAPYEIRALELRDQTRMAPVEMRERGVRF